ncbi:MAG: ATP-dependent DNA helicase RecG [Nitrospiraceae bacterium]|nr:MAG: ATP-dependent DNA helicase RecG [Nitrospiraceae bacterium]
MSKRSQKKRKGKKKTLRPGKMSKSEDERKVKPSHFSSQELHDTSVRYIKGVGPRRAQLLERIGIKTREDILSYFPWRYEDRKTLKKIRDLIFGDVETTVGKVITTELITTRRRGMKIFTASISDDSGFLTCKWFNQPYLERYFKKGQEVIVNGLVKGRPFLGSDFNRGGFQHGLEMENPDFELCENEDKLIHTSRIVPVYKATEGLTVKQMRTLMFNAIHSDPSQSIRDFMPGDILKRNNLKSLPWSIREVHFPDEFDDVSELNRGQSPGHRRIVFDEFFLLELGLALMKKREILQQGISFKGESPLLERFLRELPFRLTEAQQRVFQQIKSDMQSSSPMNRLVHGDVGCGKTVVALMSMLISADNGYQTCLMVPTELLAEQHYINIHRMVENLGLHVLLLTSSSRKTSLEKVTNGEAQIVIGTHSLIQERLQFKKLGLAVIDEQHKFGVVQRSKLRKKGFNPDILVMTATPIPRTLALTLYGDLDISLINELPTGRKSVETKVFFPSQKDRIYSLINRELSKGRQVYMVYPLIEGSEKLDLKNAVDGAEAIKKIFPTKNIALIHGKIKQDERESIMKSFKSGNIDILVATTVIEVGVDVSNASLMLIVHAERFGLAQLHQLRGRIGRGGYESYCMLMAYPPLSEEAKRRLKAMEASSDGFRIAEEDLEIRGPGEFFGTRQSGIPDLKVANIIRDIGILEASRKEAFALAEEQPSLKDYPLLREALHRKWEGKLELIKS